MKGKVLEDDMKEVTTGNDSHFIKESSTTIWGANR